MSAAAVRLEPDAWVHSAAVDLLLSADEARELLAALLELPAVEARLGPELVARVLERLRGRG